MFSENVVHIIAGVLILGATAATHFVSPWFMLILIFVGLNLLQYGFSNFCLGEYIIRKLGMKSARAEALKRAKHDSPSSVGH
ncbi:MAG: hypothetical protein Kow00107_07650 [Planctomycetota bacterium]